MTSTTEHPAARITATFRLVGGKGGVGKTTCAAGIAIAAARAGTRTLVMSTDPAPSLGDALGVRLGAAPRTVPLARGSLHAVEIDAARALDRWLAARRERLERIATRGTWLDREDVARLLRLSLPGIDEIGALFEIVRFARTGRFETIVVDTAPTGHTLRLLAMPETLRRVARVFDHLQEKHRILSSALTGTWRPDPEDALIAELDRDARDLVALLRDSDRVRTSWVTLAEPMAVEETLDAVRTLGGAGIPVHDVVFNRLTSAPAGACRRCAAHRALEARAVAAVRRACPGAPLRGVQAREREPIGVRALARIGRELDARFTPPAARSRPVIAWTAEVGRVRGRRQAAPPRRGLCGRPDSLELLMFGGKGGVGKTTCAAAAAIDAAARLPGLRVLLLSTDPAHSLADVLGVRVSDTAGPVRGAPRNLHVRELDATAGFAAIRERYSAAIDALFDRLSRGTPFDSGHERMVMHDLLDLAPPGIDELVAITDVVDALHGGYDLLVMDTAPTGHALRLLETPALVHDWTKALMSIVLKYEPVTGVGELGEILLKLSQRLRRLRALLADGSRTQLVAVTRAAALPRAETDRLLARLVRMPIAVPIVVVNAVGRGTCRACRRAVRAERAEIDRLRRTVAPRRAKGVREIVIAPAALPPPHGPRALRRWHDDWQWPKV